MTDTETSSETPGRSCDGAPVRAAAVSCAVSIVDASGVLSTEDAGSLREAIEAGVAYLCATGDVRVRIVGDMEMTDAHERWIGTRTTTDVLTFDLGTQGRSLDVDVLLCADEAARQAGERGHEAWRECALYAVHAVLHCLGYDDHEPQGAEAMHRLEDEVLDAIGVGRTYADAAGDGDATL